MNTMSAYSYKDESINNYFNYDYLKKFDKNVAMKVEYVNQ